MTNIITLPIPAVVATLLASALLIHRAEATSAEVNSPTQVSTGFEDGNLSPFVSCNTTAPSRVMAFTKDGVKCLRSYWAESSYNGTRNTKGAEACATSFATYKEGWYGFKIYVPTPGFPINKETAIGQIFQHGACNSWAAQIFIKNNALMLNHRGNCGSPTTATLVGDIQRNAWKSIVIHWKASHLKAGMIEVFYNGGKVYSATGINFGFGVWNSNDTLASGNNIGLKVGQYDYDASHYTAGETRTLYYDNVCWISGNPSGAFSTASP